MPLIYGLAASPQFGVDNQRTEVFAVDNDGQLQVTWVVGSGGWNGPKLIGPPAHSRPRPAGITRPRPLSVINGHPCPASAITHEPTLLDCQNPWWETKSLAGKDNLLLSTYP